MLFESLNNRFSGLMALDRKMAPSYDRVILSRHIDALKTLSSAGTHDGVIAAHFGAIVSLSVSIANAMRIEELL